jgi:tol-pal system protein YbgF
MTMRFALIRPVAIVFLLVVAVLTDAGTGARAMPAGMQVAAARAEAGGAIELAQIFRRRDEGAPAEVPGAAEGGPDLAVRLGRLENQIRQLTGLVEELQHRNQQLEQQLRRMQQDVEYRFEESGRPGRAPAARPQTSAPPASPPSVAGPPPTVGPGPGPSSPPGRRPDVFDPSAAPNAPGAPRNLGTLPGGGAPIIEDPARRAPGSPLDLGSLAGSAPPPAGAAPGGPGAAGPQAVLAPSGSARDEYDLAYGAILRRDYELADQAFRTFLANHAEDRSSEAQRLVPDAHYWLGESQYQRKKYNDAAEIFLDLYNKYPNSLKAPDALLRLGQSLAALGKQEAACASFGAVISKYPKAPASVKQAVEQEQKRARC